MELILKKYSAPWCSQCKNLSNEFKRNSINCTIIEEDVDELDDAVIESLGIKNIPVCILYDKDIELKRWIGYISSKEINNFIETCG